MKIHRFIILNVFGLVKHCSIPKLLHPYLNQYWNYILQYNYSKEEALIFLRMVRLKERKLAWAFKQKEKGINNKELAFVCGIKKRRNNTK